MKQLASRPTVQSVTDSILSIYGDESQPDVWAEYVRAITQTFGSHPIGPAHVKTMQPALAAYWLARFGIS